jgi:hypothetical protein
MALLHQDPSSSYINDLDFPNSSSSAAQHTISPHPSPFDQFEFNSLQGPAYPHTPSYNGSYHNSPYSGHSELSFVGDGDQFGIFEDEPAGLLEDYDPSEYDPPTSGGLLMFDTDFMSGGDSQVSVSITPADYSSPNAYDYSSPSSNGGGDSNADGQPRSRGSSVSSNPHMSPRLDVTQGLENMRFESPNWGTRALPIDGSLSPPNKPQSPPQLVIPGSPSGNNMYPQSPPVINAPDGDGGLMGEGPQLHIVPATPVSGGGGASQSAPFQTSLDTLHQGPCFQKFFCKKVCSLLLPWFQGHQVGNGKRHPAGISDLNKCDNQRPLSGDSTPTRHSILSPFRDIATATMPILKGCPTQMLKYTGTAMVTSCTQSPLDPEANPTPIYDLPSGPP